MKTPILKTLLALILVLASPIQSLPAFADDSAGNAIFQHQNDPDYFSELRAAADQYYEAHAKELTNVSQPLWKAVTNDAISQLKKVRFLTKVMKRYKGPARTTVIGDLFSDFVLGPVAAALGMPYLAMVIAVAPVGLIAGTGHLAFQLSWKQLQLSRKLDNASLSDLKKLRREIVGYDSRQHFSSVIYEAIMGDSKLTVPIDFVRKANAAQFNRPSIVVTLEEMEKLVESKGYRYLDKEHPDLYFAQLINDIAGDPELLAVFNEKLASRIPVDKGSEASQTRNLLLGFSVATQRLNKVAERLQEFVTAATKARWRSFITVDLFGPQSAGLVAEEYLGTVEDLREEIEFAEFNFLNNYDQARTLYSGEKIRRILDESAQVLDLFRKQISFLETIPGGLKNGERAFSEEQEEKPAAKSGKNCFDLLQRL